MAYSSKHEMTVLEIQTRDIHIPHPAKRTSAVRYTQEKITDSQYWIF